MKTTKINTDRVCKRLRAWYDLASAENMADGRRWYYNAHTFVQTVADKYGLTPLTVGGVVAALSPAIRWNTNKKQAEALCKAYADNWELESVVLSTYKNQARKAYRILREIHDLNGILKILGKRAFKTRAFFMNICYMDDNHVTIDRWIERACGLEGFLSPGSLHRYTVLENVVRAVASDIGEDARAFQAIIWITVHDMAEIDDPTTEAPF